MIERRLFAQAMRRLDDTPAVVLLGPRQVGKTTLALHIAEARKDAIYLDLESESDRARLQEPELYLGERLDRLVILDEIHRVPHLFPILRGLIDRARRAGRRSGLYLLLGSASMDLLRQTGESLAGRVSYLYLDPFDVLEVGHIAEDAERRLWLRGGFPESFLAADDRRSLRWRQDFIRTYLERDIPQFGRRVAAETLRRFWVLLAYHQGGLLNVAQLARDVGIDAKTAASYLDLLVDLLLVRRLPPWHANVGKRLVKSPKVYVRDSGILHALLGIANEESLLAHPVLGASWEGFVIENLLAVAGGEAEGYFYRTSGGAEVDLILRFSDGRTWAIEVKRGLAPKLSKGFRSACKDLRPDAAFVVYSGKEAYPLARDVTAIPLRELAKRVAETARMD
ncbi:MAG: ATP-binding protein [Zetaproteobacteria bacterium]|nr:MAG: ATP-binding protein [Zetaproteobacteria bacterium]